MNPAGEVESRDDDEEAMKDEDGRKSREKLVGGIDRKKRMKQENRLTRREIKGKGKEKLKMF